MKFFFINILPLVFLLLFCGVIIINSYFIKKKIDRIDQGQVLFKESYCSVKFLSSKRLGAHMGLITISLTDNGILYLRPPLLLCSFLAKNEQKILYGLDLRYLEDISNLQQDIILKIKDLQSGQNEDFQIRVKDKLKLFNLLKQFDKKSGSVSN